jgi:hypothetical protein
MTAEVKVLYVDVDDAYVPAVIEGTRSWKNASEVEVIVIEPVLFHW